MYQMSGLSRKDNKKKISLMTILQETVIGATGNTRVMLKVNIL